jgi:hypothetical protein
MNIWILIIFIYTGTSPVVDHVEFAAEQTCKIAAQAVAADPMVHAFCFAK